MNNAEIIACAILKLYPHLDAGQLEIIAHTDGPTLGIAGPGAGKTLVIALRGVNILLRGLAPPEELALCTYNQRAARELHSRFRFLADASGCPGDVSRVRISTIHSLCHRILEPHARRVGLLPGYRLLDEQEQRSLMLECFDDIFGDRRRDLERRGWRRPHAVVRNARKYFDRIADELVDPRDLMEGDSLFLSAVGRCYLRYRDLLLERNMVDFAHLQVWADELLDCDLIADRLAVGMRYLMCDEYQDTSHVQERILLRLARGHGNLCAVGDEDQSLYRFRGASVENILRFPDRFDDCHTVELSVNYRSHSDIVRACGRWMASADWRSADPDGRAYRHDKVIRPGVSIGHDDYPAVIAVDGRGPSDEGRQLGELLRFLRRSRVIDSYGQVALLLHSVREEVSGPYLDALDDAGIAARSVPAGSSSRRQRSSEVTVTTIHQAKGLEWDVVIVGSLDFHNRDVDLVGRLLRPYCHRPSFEPLGRVAEFDHMRQHYVAFSRAKRLLVLTAGGAVHPRFDPIWDDLPRWGNLTRSDRAALARQRFRTGECETVPEPSPAPAAVPRVIPFLQRLDVLVKRSSVVAG